MTSSVNEIAKTKEVKIEMNALDAGEVEAIVTVEVVENGESTITVDTLRGSKEEVNTQIDQLK